MKMPGWNYFAKKVLKGDKKDGKKYIIPNNQRRKIT